MGARAAGIDLGASELWLVTAARSAGGRWLASAAERFPAGDLDAVVAACDGATVAIDAPAARSESLHLDDERVVGKFRRARCAEVGLRLAGHAVAWVAPAADEEVPGWMAAGFRLHSALEAAGSRPLEVFPHAVFRELLGERPPRKQTAAGRRARLEALARELALPAEAGGWRHDAIDAAAAAVVAAHHAEGRARPAGCGHPGAPPMWLPAGPG